MAGVSKAPPIVSKPCTSHNPRLKRSLYGVVPLHTISLVPRRPVPQRLRPYCVPGSYQEQKRYDGRQYARRISGNTVTICRKRPYEDAAAATFQEVPPTYGSAHCELAFQSGGITVQAGGINFYLREQPKTEKIPRCEAQSIKLVPVPVPVQVQEKSEEGELEPEECAHEKEAPEPTKEPAGLSHLCFPIYLKRCTRLTHNHNKHSDVEKQQEQEEQKEEKKVDPVTLEYLWFVQQLNQIKNLGVEVRDSGITGETKEKMEKLIDVVKEFKITVKKFAV
jgi:hypothetical protein